MVVSKESEQVYEVVLVVESTANLVPYFDILMKSYIVPSLEYFNNGPPDPIDYGIDFCCTLYDVVTFHAGDIAPGPTAGCTKPTNSIHEVITHLERMELVGGAGQASSHIAEGLSTALQVFDDFKKVRHPGVTSVRHCILICNSPPYHMGAEESSDYSGFNSEQLATMMGKRGIHLSVISPKKIAALQKMFDAAGAGEGTYTSHPQKDYTVDSRHMVLLHGYQLQERAHSPAAEEDKQMDPNKIPHSGTGEGPFKVPSSVVPGQPSMPMGNQPNSQQPGQNPAVMGVPNPQMMGNQPPPHQMGPGMPPHPHLGPHPQGFQPSMVNMMPGSRMSGQQLAAVRASMRANDSKNHIMVGAGGPVSHPGMMGPGGMAISTQGMMVPTGQTVMAPQGSGQTPHMSIMQQQNQASGMGNPMGVSSASSMPSSQPLGMNNPNMMATSMALSQAQNPSFPAVSQGAMGPRAGGPQQPGMNFAGMQANMAGGNVNSSSVGAAGMAVPSTGNGDMTSDPNAANRQNAPSVRDRKFVWTGALEYHEKSKANPGQVGQQQKITWLLSCRISIACTEPDLTTVSWPEKLALQLLPQNMLSELQSLCRNSRQVAFHFSNTDQEALRNLHKLMGTGFAGCVHFPQQSASETRIILLLFSVKKRAFIGLIPNDQSAFVQGIKNVLTQHKLKNQPKALHTAMAQTGLSSISQQNLPQGQGATAMDTSVLTGSQNPLVSATAGPGGAVGNQSMISGQNPGQTQQQAMQSQMLEAKQLQFQNKQASTNQKNAMIRHQQLQQQQQLMAQQQMNRQQQAQQANQQPLRQMVMTQQQMRQQLMMQQQQQQQHGRQPGPQNVSGVMPPGSQAQMQGMQMGQMGGQSNQSLSMDDFNFDFM